MEEEFHFLMRQCFRRPNNDGFTYSLKILGITIMFFVSFDLYIHGSWDEILTVLKKMICLTNG